MWSLLKNIAEKSYSWRSTSSWFRWTAGKGAYGVRVRRRRVVELGSYTLFWIREAQRIKITDAIDPIFGQEDGQSGCEE